MMKFVRTAAILSVLILPGCGTLPLIDQDDDLPKRQKPVEAMSACSGLSALPADLPDLTAEKAVSLILRAHLNDIAAYHDCEYKHGALKNWINGME